MSPQQVTAIVDFLWPFASQEHTAHVYAILDGARNPRIAELVRNSGLEYACMYSGTLSAALEQAAPYLVRLTSSATLTYTYLKQGWGQSWGVLVEVGAETGFEQVRKHFRSLQRVGTQGGARLVFRFYDPRVLREYLPTCTLGEVDQFFGPAVQFMMEASNQPGAALLSFRPYCLGVLAQCQPQDGISKR